MNIVNVIPISKGIAKNELSYYSSNFLNEGSVVFVPLRGRDVPAVVLSVENLKEKKSKIRSSNFALKKITSNKSKKIFSNSFIKATKDVAYENISSQGALIYSLTPKAILEKPEEINEIKNESEKENLTDKIRGNVVNEKLILQKKFEERIEEYKKLIRSYFARNESVILLAPTIKEGEKIYEILNKGIEDFSFLLHSGFSKKEQISKWNKVTVFEKPALVVITGSFISVPAFNIGVVIIENANSTYYKMETRPFIDLKKMAIKISSEYKAKTILGGLPLNINDFYKYKEGIFEALESPSVNIKSNVKPKIIDMRPKVEEESLEEKMKNTKSKKIKGFKILSEDIYNLIEKSEKQDMKIFIFASRKGLASTAVCEDCGDAIKCKKCNAVMGLYKKGKYNSFVCRACGEEDSALLKCRNCGSWKLKSLGIGSEKVYEEIKKEFKDLKIILFDSKNASTHKKATKLIDDFYSSTSAVLVGTEKVLSYLESVDYSVIASLDSLLSIPDFKIEEKVFSLILKISSKTKKEFLIQTRIPDAPSLSFGIRGDFSSFYRNEIELRKTLNYPPFSKFIKVICTLPASSFKKEEMKIKSMLLEFEPFLHYPKSKKAPKGKRIVNFIIKTTEVAWPDNELINSLKQLPPSCAVDTEPKSLFG